MTAALQISRRAFAKPEAGELSLIALSDLIESPWNPRRHFDPAKLAETAESLRVNGQLTPITVRPAGDRFEIGAGHRRFRAAPQAGLTSLLAVVRALDDVAFLELLTIENKQREDVTPLDEAAGFKLLMEKAGYDVAKLAARIGLSTKYVYDRLKLLQLVPRARKYLEDGTITAGHAILLARLSPSDQGRAIGDPEGASDYGRQDGGLFQPEHIHPELDLHDSAVKARTVRELATWIDDNIRFTEKTIDPFLFPDTAAAVAGAQEDEEKVVHITHDYRVSDGARDEHQRTYGEQAWKRADGKAKSKRCEFSVLGVVVAGHGRGEAFRVCVRKDKCQVHWAKEQRQLAEDRKYRQQSAESQASLRAQARADEKRQIEEQARTRWKKATPALVAALAAAIKGKPAGPTSPIGRFFLRDRRWDVARKHLGGPRTVEDLVRHLVLEEAADQITGYWAMEEGHKTLKFFGVDAKKILDEAAPEPEKAKAPKGGKRAARHS